MPYSLRAAVLSCSACMIAPAAGLVPEQVLRHLGDPAVEMGSRIESAVLLRAGKTFDSSPEAAGRRVVTDTGKPLGPDQLTRLPTVRVADDMPVRCEPVGTTTAPSVPLALVAESFSDVAVVLNDTPASSPLQPPAVLAKPAAPTDMKPEPGGSPPPPLPQGYIDTPPPGWLPLNRLDDKTLWKDVQSVKDKVHLYLPNGDKPVRGVYLSVVFHSQDPRELARLWDYALVTVPWEMLYDVGLTDKRVKRGDLTKLPVGNMGWMLHYLEKAAVQTKHPELASAPIVGWLMQSGWDHAPDLLNRAGDRVVAWADSFPGPIRKHSTLLEKCPYVIAWEFGPADEKKRRTERDLKLKDLAGKPTPAQNLLCEVSTYDFPHGIYSKWNIFAVFLDRCIKARVPSDLPEPGQPVKLQPIALDAGWCADFNDVSEWVAIAPAKEAKGMVSPVWLPDEYAAWAYRAFHSHNPDLTLTAPVTEYLMPRSAPRGDRGVCGLGFGKVQGKAGEPVTLEAGPRGQVAKDKPVDRPWAYTKIEFRDGDKLLGTADKAPWQLAGVKFDAGLHALFVVGVRADGTRTCSRPALYGVR